MMQNLHFILKPDEVNITVTLRNIGIVDLRSEYFLCVLSEDCFFILIFALIYLLMLQFKTYLHQLL